MKLIKLTALTSLLFVFFFGINSCEKNAEKKKITDYQKNGLALTGASETPATTSTALGTMDVFYSKETRILTWSVTWTGLTGPVALMHIHGKAPVCCAAGVVQNIITPGVGTGIAVPNATLYPATGKISGTLLIDDFIIKEADLLDGFYYMNIHTATFPSGEIRGQILFQ